MDLPQWTEVYPQGTPEGDEEQRFFIALARSKDNWVSTERITKSANLSTKRVEEIVNKYLKKGIILKHSSKDNVWGYWERNLDSIEKEKKTITENDQDLRIKDHLGLELIFDFSNWIANIY